MRKPKLKIVPNTVDASNKPHADGRVRRSERSRRKIIDAVIALVEEGVTELGAAEIAKKAGVGLRSVFRHFDDMDSLYSDMIAQLELEILPIVYAPLQATTWEERVNALLERRTKVYERIMPIRIFSSLRRFKSPILMNDFNRMVGMERKFLKDVLPKEILSNKLLFEALDMTTSFSAWRRLRVDSGLSVKRASAVVKESVWKLIDR